MDMDVENEVTAGEATEQSDVHTNEQQVASADTEQVQDAETEAGEGEAGADDNADGGDTEQLEPIAAPTSWAKDAKEVFGNLPREAQEIIARREADREKFVQSKSREAANTRTAVESEARQALSTIMNNHAVALQQFLPPVPQMPDPRLLQSAEHRDLYFQQKAEYDYAIAQRDAVAQQIEQVQQHAGAINQQQLQAEIQAEYAALEDALGNEWSDPSERAKLLDTLQPIAAELGYSQEVMAQARASDILALRRIRTAFEKEARWDQLQKRKMEPVRAAKTSLPPAARPGVIAANTAPVDAEVLLYPDDVRR